MPLVLALRSYPQLMQQPARSLASRRHLPRYKTTQYIGNGAVVIATSQDETVTSKRANAGSAAPVRTVKPGTCTYRITQR